MRLQSREIRPTTARFSLFADLYAGDRRDLVILCRGSAAAAQSGCIAKNAFQQLSILVRVLAGRAARIFRSRPAKSSVGGRVACAGIPDILRLLVGQIRSAVVGIGGLQLPLRTGLIPARTLDSRTRATPPLDCGESIAAGIL